MSYHFPIAVVPSVRMGGDGGGRRVQFRTESIALVSIADARVLCGETFSGALGRFVKSFRDEFGAQVEPSLIVCRNDDRAGGATRDAVSAFRHVLGMSTILLARARRIGHRSMPGGVLWAETFTLYPWMVGKDAKSLIALTPAQTGFSTVDEFAGASLPGLPRVILSEGDIDEPLFGALSRAWQTHFVEGKRCPESRALFRSIAAANEALRMPGGSDYTTEDVGRLSIPWTSAFETLIWPLHNHADLKRVLDVICQIEWTSRRLQTKCKTFIRNEKSFCVTHPAWVYHNLYKLRNDYAHGNEIKGAEHARHTHIVRVAAVLFRCILAHRLGVWRGNSFKTEEGELGSADLAQFVIAHLKRSRITDSGLEFERALLWYRGRSVLMRQRSTSTSS